MGSELVQNSSANELQKAERLYIASFSGREKGISGPVRAQLLITV